MDVFPILRRLASAPEEKASLKKQLALYLNDLLLHDFPALVQLLYRVDVSEAKLKSLLKEKPHEDAGDLIAGLLIERQAEKEAAKKNSGLSMDGSEEERW